ncbi:MAG: zf-HC2 domain-containing protein [Oscillospiraceae bacterium]
MSQECEYFEELILRVPDGDLTDAEAAELQTHLRACPECRRLFKALRSVSGALSDASAEPPADFADGVMERIFAQPTPASSPRRKKAKPNRRWRSLSVAACLVLIAGVAVFGASRLRNAGRGSDADESVVLERSMAAVTEESAPAEAPMPEPAAYSLNDAPMLADAYEEPIAGATEADSAAANADPLAPMQVPAGREAEFEAIITDSHEEPNFTTASWDVIAYVEYKGIVYEFLTDAEGQSLLWRDAAEGVYPIVSPQNAEALLAIFE